MSHTEGKLEYQERSDAYTHIIRGPGWRMIACAPQGSDGTDEANARRLVACWNACDGVSTESLENSGEETSRPVLALNLGNATLRADKAVLEIERDELLELLRYGDSKKIETILARYQREGKS